MSRCGSVFALPVSLMFALRLFRDSCASDNSCFLIKKPNPEECFLRTRNVGDPTSGGHGMSVMGDEGGQRGTTIHTCGERGTLENFLLVAAENTGQILLKKQIRVRLSSASAMPQCSLAIATARNSRLQPRLILQVFRMVPVGEYAMKLIASF